MVPYCLVLYCLVPKAAGTGAGSQTQLKWQMTKSPCGTRIRRQEPPVPGYANIRWCRQYTCLVAICSSTSRPAREFCSDQRPARPANTVDNGFQEDFVGKGFLGMSVGGAEDASFAVLVRPVDRVFFAIFLAFRSRQVLSCSARLFR
jgi:hypothetical protein